MRFGLSAYFFADISNAFRMSPKRLADKAATFGVSKKMFVDKSIAFGVSKKMFADNSAAFGMFKKMFADNSDAFGMSLNRILLLQTFRSKFLFGGAVQENVFCGESQAVLMRNGNESCSGYYTVILNLFQDLTASLHLSISADRC